MTPFLRRFHIVALCFIRAGSTIVSSQDHGLTSSICALLASSLPGKVSLPNSTAYDRSVDSYFFTNEALHPGCIVSPDCTSEVATFVKAVGGCSSRITCDFAIRGGGMAANKGAAAIDNGVTLDLSALNSLSLSSDRSVLHAGGGATWGQVYTHLDPQNLSAVGSRVSSSGLGGSITGGGLSFFSPRRGFNCDSVSSFEVVLASGKIVNTNVTTYPDLFRALKGGSNNFGIITRFDINTFEQGTFWGGAIEYPESADAAQLKALAEFKDPNNYDPDAESELSFLYLSSTNTFTSANNMFYAKPIVNASGLGPFLRVTPQTLNTMRIGNSSTFAKEIYQFSPKHTYGTLATFSFKSSLQILTEMHSIWKSSTSTLQHVANLTYNLDFQGVPPAVSQSNNSLGTPAATADMVLLLLSNYWTAEADSTSVMNATRSVLADLRSAAANAGVLQQWQYINYAAPWQTPLAGYGAANLAFLKSVATKYDPTGMFQKQVPGGFKLSTSM